ncbi:Imm26 family immunity protein [Rhodanobacter denitrificans]|uniref:Imm26 family immunity protein n=1 Tax=Rhodanobacter denitrificans TaxID=666685 RepID=UPI0011C04743|nr:Imm26 family immunity protein [Rhodanobacter denitrificans]
MIRKRVKYKVGDVFLIPSSKNGFYVGQVAADTTAEIGAPFCFIYDENALSDNGCENLTLDTSQIISASLITPELIKFGEWKVCANKPVPSHVAMQKLEQARKNGFVGSKVVGGGLVAEYLDTFYGIVDVDQWPDPNYVYRFFLVPLPAHKTR